MMVSCCAPMCSARSRTAAIPRCSATGPYAKGMSFEASRPYAWKRLVDRHPEGLAGSSNKYQAWELLDPKKWVPEGYAIVRVDSRGAGRSPGHVDPWSQRETWDIYECIEGPLRSPGATARSA